MLDSTASRLRIFLGMYEVAGYYRALKEGLVELGHDVTFVDLSLHPFGYGGSDYPSIASATRWLEKQGQERLVQLHNAPRMALFAWAIARFDVFIFSYGSSLLPDLADLPLLEAAGKTIIFQFHGSDSRPPYIDGALMSAATGVTITQAVERTYQKKGQLAVIDRWADAVIDIPPQALLHERPYVNWLEVGLTCRPQRVPSWGELLARRPPAPGTPLRLLHSPSNPQAKGSVEIAACVERLRAEGHALELVDIRGRPNAEVLAELDRADLVLDQLYADYAMPGFACEAAWFGRPVLIGGYATELWSALLPVSRRPPTTYCRPEAFEAELRALVLDPARRRRQGLEAREFVERVWNPRAVAQRYVDIALGRAPSSWLLDPRDIRYWQGVGLSDARARALIAAYVREGGRAALCLGDKPELERLFLDIAGASDA